MKTYVDQVVELTEAINAKADGNYWYINRGALEAGQVFRTLDGAMVKLGRRVEGDGTKWEVADWFEAIASWCYEGSEIEPGDLQGEPIEDTPATIGRKVYA